MLPVWDGTEFVNGAATIRDEFVRLVTAYGQLAESSPAIDGADPTVAPDDDILGNNRTSPDLGAYEFGASRRPSPRWHLHR